MTTRRPPARRRHGERGPGRPRVPALSEASIYDAALRIIDGEGLAALSMRRLAAALQVDPMSIYHHVANKDALRAGVIELALREHAPTDDPAAPWRERVRNWARQYRALAMAHPKLVLALVADTAAVARLAPATLEPLYAALATRGLSPPEVVDVGDALVDYVHGFVLAESPHATGRGFDRGRVLADVDEAKMPTVARVLGSLPAEELAYDFDAGFERGLDLLLAGIPAYRRSHEQASSTRAHPRPGCA